MKVAFVIPWYGEDIPGGAEAVCRETTRCLHGAEVEVEVLTTCVKDFHHPWHENYHKPGAATVGAVLVRRFPVERRDVRRFDELNGRLMRTPVSLLWEVGWEEGEPARYSSPLSAEEERTFIVEMIKSPELYKYLRDHGDAYELFLFVPYMFSTSVFGSEVWPDKSVLIPCLHDESYAYMGIYREMFARARGFLFHSESEQQLAARLYEVPGDNAFVLGAGVNTEVEASAERFREKYGIARPFLLYVGRKDPTKNTDLLISYFARYRASRPDSDVLLVLAGGGTLPPEQTSGGDVIDVGFIPMQDKYDAYSAALCTCQPSVHESFSLTIMESWVVGTPALVNGVCDVTREHCVKSNGGLYFTSAAEFAECVDFYLNNHSLRQRLGARGRDYVVQNYRWETVIQKYRHALEQLSRR